MVPVLLVWVILAGQLIAGGGLIGSGPTLPATCVPGDTFIRITAGLGLFVCDGSGDWQILPGSGGAGVPTGAVVLITSGACPAGFAEAVDLDGVMLRGTLAAHADVGTTGGNDSITPAGTNSTPTFSGNALAGHVHNFTGSALAGHSHTFTGSALGTHSHAVGTYAADAVSAGTPAGTIAWPAGVPTNSGGAVNAHSGTAVADHPSHTHTYTDVVNHVHVQNMPSGFTGGSSLFTQDTSVNGSTASYLSTANPTGGVATGTTAGPSATLIHSVTQPASHVFTQPTIAWPAGVPTFSGSALSSHSHTVSGSSGTVSAGTPAGTNSSDSAGTPAGTLDSVSAGTPSGTITAPAFTGTSFDNRPAFIRVIFCRKT